MPARRSGALRVLRGELKKDWETARRLADQTIQFWEAAEKPIPKIETVYAVALSLHHLYSAFESYFERVAKRLDETVPQGDHWHHELLEQMALEIPDVRPAVLDEQLKKDLDELRRFRHVVRPSYESELEWERMRRVLDGLADKMTKFETDAHGRLDAFLADAIKWLDDK